MGRVASERLGKGSDVKRQAAYFEVGDTILFGKYLNKKGIIKSFSKNEKGDPVVEIEPVPKGQKQNKTIKLFKIRKDMKTASRVASRYLEAAKSVEDILKQLRKGTWGGITSIKKLQEVLDYLGGWRVEPFVGLVDLNEHGSPTFFFNSSQGEVEKRYQVAKKSEVRSLPSSPKADVLYTMNVEDIGQSRRGDYEFKFRAWVGAWGFKVTSPEGKVLELLPDFDAYKGGVIWVDPLKLPKLGKRSAKYIKTYTISDWFKKETNLQKQILEALNMEEHVSGPSAEKTREGTGSCPACFRNIKTKLQSGKEHPVMVNHGFQRPGWGYIVGNCMGVGYPPFELSPEGTKALHESLKNHLASLEVLLKKLEGTQDLESDRVLQRTKRDIELITQDVKTLDKLIREWKPRPLPKPGEYVKVWKSASMSVAQRYLQAARLSCT